MENRKESLRDKTHPATASRRLVLVFAASVTHYRAQAFLPANPSRHVLAPGLGKLGMERGIPVGEDTNRGRVFHKATIAWRLFVSGLGMGFSVGAATNRAGTRCFHFMLHNPGSSLSKAFLKTASAYSKTAIFFGCNTRKHEKV